MTATSNERRKVAKRMRVYSHDFDFGDSDPFCYVAKAAFGDVDVHTYYSVFARLADLIDPTCHVVTSSEGILGCDRCHTVMLAVRGKPSFCPNCGARVVSDDE